MHITRPIKKLVQQTAQTIDTSKQFAKPFQDIEIQNKVTDSHTADTVKNIFDGISAAALVVILFPCSVEECFEAAVLTGQKGRIIGIELSAATLEKNRQAAKSLHYNNMEFRLSDSGRLPVTSNMVDVVTGKSANTGSLDPKKIIKEIHRILKPGGRFSISVHLDELPIGKDEFINCIRSSGFINAALHECSEIIFAAQKPADSQCRVPGCC